MLMFALPAPIWWINVYYYRSQLIFGVKFCVGSVHWCDLSNNEIKWANVVLWQVWRRRQQLILHLASFARSSVISRVSCRFMSSHWATVLNRLLFCSLSLRWACFSSATVPNRSFPSLEPNKQLVVTYENTLVIGGKHMRWLKRVKK